MAGIRDDCVRVQGQHVRRTLRRELLGGVRSDVRLALRSLRHSLPFTVVLVLVLALGMGATTTTFSMLDALLLRPLPYPDPDRLGVVWERRPLEGVERDRFTLEQYAELVASTRAFDGTAAFTTTGMTLAGGGPAERLGVVVTTSSLLPLLGARPLHGRLLGPGDDAPNSERVLVLSYQLWQRRFGGDPSVVGRSIDLNGTAYPIVGVLTPDFDDRAMRTWAGAADLFIPIGSDRRYGIWTVIGRRRPDVSWGRVQADLDVFAAAKSRDRNQTIEIPLAPLLDEVAGDLGWGLVALFGSAGILLLITCANVATLLLSRAPLRRQEMAVYAALGANRRQLVRRALAESVIVAVIAGALSLVVAVGVQRALHGLPPSVEWSDRGLGGWKSLPWLRDVGMNLRVLGFTGVVTTVTTLFFGLWPASRASRADPGSILKGGATSRSFGGRRFAIGGQDILLGIQVALTMILLVGAGLLVRSFLEADRTDLGIESHHVLTMYANPAGESQDMSYRTRAAAVGYYESVLDRVRSIPGIEAAGFIDGLPQAGSVGWTRLYPADRPPPALEEADVISVRHVTPDYFRTMGIPLQSGRVFDARDTDNSDRVVVVDARLAGMFWPGRDAVGQVLKPVCEDCTRTYTVVGVVDPVRYRALELGTRPSVYDVLAQSGDGGHGMYLVARTGPPPETLVDEVRAAFAAIDPNQPVIDVRTMDARLADALLPRRLAALVLQSFALLALLITAVGLYGSVLHRLGQARHGIAVCMALGAQKLDVQMVVVRRTVAMVGAGVLLGLLATLALTGLLERLLYGVAPTDAPTFAVLAIVLLVVAGLAAWIPARRATRIDPMRLLRTT